MIIDLLERFSNKQFCDPTMHLDFFEGRKVEKTSKETCSSMKLLPGISVDSFEQKFGFRLGLDTNRLLSRCSGFYIGNSKINFSAYNNWPYTFLLDSVCVLYSEENGNYFFVVELERKTGRFSRVWYVDHDPPVLAFVSRNIVDFTNDFLVLFSGGSSFASADFPKIRLLAARAWRMNARFPTASEVLNQSIDSDLIRFAKTMSGETRIADLRAEVIGDGLDWSSHSQGCKPLSRMGICPVFGVSPSAGILRRIFG